MKPSVGRIVHYYPPATQGQPFEGVEPLAAIVTKVRMGSVYTCGASPPQQVVGVSMDVDLSVFCPGCASSSNHVANAPFSREPAVGCWNWPNRD